MKQYVNYKVYDEVYKTLENNAKIKNKIPADILEHIRINSLKNKENLIIDNSIDILKQISRIAFCLYLSLYLQYVADENEREKFKQILIDNELSYRKNLA